MSRNRLLFLNLIYHRRGNLAVLLGVAVSTAVLAGALIVGDSLRGSLADLTKRRLAWVDQALMGSRFFREDLANADVLGCEYAAGCILLQGSASTGETEALASGIPRSVGKVTIIGTNDGSLLLPSGSFMKFTPRPQAQAGSTANDENNGDVPVYLNTMLAQELKVKEGDAIAVNLQKISLLPREALLGQRDSADLVNRVPARVAGILDESDPGNRFNLSPSPEPPLNLFIPLPRLQSLINQPGLINALLVKNPGVDLPKRLAASLTLKDWGLELKNPQKRTDALFARLDRNKRGRLRRAEWQGRMAEALAQAADANHDGELTHAEVLNYYEKEHPYLSLESRAVYLAESIAQAAKSAASKSDMLFAPTLVYVANAIRAGDASIPYSVVAALDSAMPSPLGPFGKMGQEPLKEDEILLADWDQSPIHPKMGDAVTVSYFPATEGASIKEQTASFRFKGYVPLEGVGADPDLAPEFPGVTDFQTLNLRDWKLPSPPFDNALIRKQVGARDEEFWKRYRTTPKAYVSLEAGKKMWGSRFGALTSIRLAPRDGGNLKSASERFEKHLLISLSPSEGGFEFQNVREEGLTASQGGADIGQLFLGFSFFLIVAALLLVGLLFRLNLERRASDFGILLATGYRRRAIQMLVLGEGLIITAAGSLLGLLAGYGYAQLLLGLLEKLWPGSFSLSFLQLHVTGISLLAALTASLAMSLLTMIWGVRILGKVAPPALMRGQTMPDPVAGAKSRWAVPIAIGNWLAALILIVAGVFTSGETRAGCFLSSGAALLISGLAVLWIFMKRAASSDTSQGARDARSFTFMKLAMENTCRNPLRSLLTAGLLAFSVFLIVAVELFRPRVHDGSNSLNTGTGGFGLIADLDAPLFKDPNQGIGKADFLEKLELNKQNREKTAPDRADRELREQREIFDQLRFYAVKVKAGDDASCLNLYQPKKPRLLGVPGSFIERGGFKFESEAQGGRSKSYPWELLNKKLPEGEIPVIGDANTVTWMLKNHLGGIVSVQDDAGHEVKLRIVGLLDHSLFQSGLILSEANFLKLYPGQEGYSQLLIETHDVPLEKAKEVVQLALADHGVTVVSAKAKLDSFLAVEGMYLSTFQALGALGLLLGGVGLAVVLLRGIWERRAELALLRALGYRNQALGGLLFSENGLLLLGGVGLGTLAAIIAVAPSLVTGEASVPWGKFALMLAAVALVGSLCAAVALYFTLRAPLVAALRHE